MEKEKTCLIITGCISPEGDIPSLVVKNADERRRQYRESLLFYIRQSSVHCIIFCDNSDSRIDEDIIVAARENGIIFEWLSFKGDIKKTQVQGKGYGEGEIVRYTLDNSKIINQCDSFIKVTGKLIVKNLNKCISLLDNKYCYFDFHNSFVDTRCYIANIELYKNYLYESYKNVMDNDKYYLEMAMFSDIPHDDVRFRQIPFYLDIVGQSGSTGIMMKSPKLIVKVLKNLKRIYIWLDREVIHKPRIGKGANV